jgi:hypothetical protein
MVYMVLKCLITVTCCKHVVHSLAHSFFHQINKQIYVVPEYFLRSTLKSRLFSLKLDSFDTDFEYEYVDVPTGNFFKKSVEKTYPFSMKTYLIWKAGGGGG